MRTTLPDVGEKLIDSIAEVAVYEVSIENVMVLPHAAVKPLTH